MKKNKKSKKVNRSSKKQHKVLTFFSFLVLVGSLFIKIAGTLIVFSSKQFNTGLVSVRAKWRTFSMHLVSLYTRFVELLKSYRRRLIVKTSHVSFSRPQEVFKNLWFSSKNVKTKTKPKLKKKTAKAYKKVQPLSNFQKAIKSANIFLLGILAGLLFIALPFQISAWYKQLPQPELLANQQPKTTKILDRKGRLLYEIYVDKKYEPIELEVIPTHVVQATLAIEDSEFYDHNGIRLDSIIRAARATLLQDELQGGSTITQQLIKIVLLTPERTLQRKVKELVLAVRVESKFTKNEILEMYFNNIPYGGTAWGIQSASQKFFGKDVQDLSLAEATLLAGLPSAPSVYSPLTGNENLAKMRQRHVLNRMVELGYISEKEANTAYDQKLDYAPQVEYIRAPHFVAYVREELVSKYGERYVDFGGLTVTTTLDLDLQDKAQAIVKEEVAKSKSLNISNGAAIVLDAHSSQILAYVGSRDYFAEGDGAYDVLRAYRQPGSSIKPITYVLALENGATAATTIEDKPLTIQSYGQTYTPVNYDGRYHGTVTLRQALANSYNIPAVKMLRSVGADNMVALGKKLGLQGWEVGDTYGLAVTLGGKEVRLLDLANAYATFARLGIHKEVTPFLTVKDSNGFDLYTADSVENRVLTEESTYLLSHILSDNSARAPAFGYNSALVVPNYTVAVKTGTTDQNRDNLTVGYTPSYVVGVWVGNNDNTPMNRQLVSGLSGAAPIWNKVISTVLQGKDNEVFNKPDSVFVKMDKECDNRSEVFVKGTAPINLCPQKDKEKASKS